VARLEDDTPWMGPLPAVPGCDCQICRPEEWYDELDRQTIDAVLEHGWQVMLVAAAADCSDCDHDHSADDIDGSGPPFAYTIGLQHRFGHPELLISGLDYGLMHDVLDGLARRVMAGRRLVPGDALEEVLPGAPVAVEQVADEGLREAVTWSGWFHRRKPEALAVVWPDRRGVFGWQPGAPAVLDELQPREWREPIVHTGGLATDPSWDFPVPADHLVVSCTHVLDDGKAVLWAARVWDELFGDEWSIHCGGLDHETDELRLVHISHLVRSAPSLRQIADLELGQEALRIDTDSDWATGPVPL